MKNRCLFANTNLTLDAKHNEMLKYFKDLKKSLPAKRKKLKEYRSEYKNLCKKAKKDLSNDEFQQKFSLEDIIKQLEKDIYNIESNKEENDYFLNTGQLLYQY